MTRRSRRSRLAAPAAIHLGAPRGWAAICTLAERGLAARLIRAAPAAVAVTGPLFTVSRGLERLVANLAARPGVRTLLLCGREPRGVPARKAIRHLWEKGLTRGGRIRGLAGLPPLRNLDPRSLSLVRRRVRLTDLGPTRRVQRILGAARALPPGRPSGTGRPPRGVTVEAPAAGPRDHGLDPTGYFVILAPTPDGRICCEHYRRDGTLTRRFLGRDAAGLCRAILRRRLAGTAEHAAYLGRELQKAEIAVRLGVPYSQDDPLPRRPGRRGQRGSGISGPRWTGRPR